MSRQLKVLIFDSSTGYTIQYWRFIKKYYPDLDITMISKEDNRHLYEKAGKYFLDNTIFYSTKRFMKVISLYFLIKKLPQYDIVHTLWIDKFWGIVAAEVQKKTKVWLASVGGSDLYRHSAIPDNRKWQDKVLKYASGFSSENTTTREYFYEVYGDKLRNKPHNINRYGVDILDELKQISASETQSIRDKWNIPSDRIVVMLGHNARVEHQHREMISAISKMDKDIIDKCYFVIPMTYPSGVDEYISEIDDAMKKVTDQYQILTEYMNVREMAETTRCCDVMIHVQTTDQLSSTMVAHMYDENIVIAGSWLPYSDIHDEGIEFYDVDTIPEIAGLLSDIVSNIDVYREKVCGNREKVYKFSSWEYAAKAWYNTYIELLEESKK